MAKNKNLENLTEISQLHELGICLLSSHDNADPKILSLPTGSYQLNRALGIGGWPEGKIIEIFGSDSSGKSTLALQTIAEAQALGRRVIYFDLENTLNVEWARKLGVAADKLLVARPDVGEKAFSLMRKVVENNFSDLIVVDSVASLIPSLEFEGNIQDQTMGLHARLMSKGLRILQSSMVNSRVTILFINQIREKIGNTYVPLTTTTGGRALKYAACVRVELRRGESIKNSAGDVVGFLTRAIVVKNKYGSPLTTANMALYFDVGFDLAHEIMAEALARDLIVRKGSWFEYGGKNIAQGTAHLRKLLHEDRALRAELSAKLFN